jgi:glycosyltransferase involved in cell wall biosynthesis
LSQDLWIRSSRIRTIPNGVHLAAEPQSSIRAELEIGAADRLIVTIGNLYPVKGHRYLLEAFALLADQFPGLHVAIAGRGELESALLARADELRLRDRFHLLGLRSDIANLLAGADVFVLPSLSEGLPLALLEAMMVGRPIVATDVGEVSVALADGAAGILVPPGDSSALAAALARLLSDPSEARRVAEAAGRRAVTEYALCQMVERYASLYSELIVNARGRRASRTPTLGVA